jgi:hypothetical protein
MKLSCLLFFIVVICSCEKRINTTDSFLKELHQKYSETWLDNLVFDQKTSFYKEDSLTNIQRWREVLAIPNLLHIRFGAFENGNGMIFKNDSQYVFQSGKIVRKIAEINNLQYFAFDIYKSNIADNLAMLKKQGFDTNIFRVGNWEGRSVYIIGANSNNLKSNQLWYDKNNLTLLRVIYMNRGSLVEAHLNEYKKFDKSFIAEKIKIFVNNKLFMLEEYSNVQVNQTISNNIFEPGLFNEATF